MMRDINLRCQGMNSILHASLDKKPILFRDQAQLEKGLLKVSEMHKTAIRLGKYPARSRLFKCHPRYYEGRYKKPGETYKIHLDER